MFNNFKPVLVFAGLLGYASYAEAVLEAVIVSGARTEQSELTTPASITVITRDEIEASGARHVVDVLRGRGGIQVVDNYGDGSRSSISMRGFGEAANANTLVLVDGRRLNNSDIAAPDLNSIALDDVERIEVVHGSAGVLFGDQAVGGVINIITRRPGISAHTVMLSVGSYDNTEFHGSTSRGLDNGLSYRLSLDLRESDNYRRHNEASYLNGFGKLGYDYETGSVFAELQYIDDELETPGALFTSDVAADRRQVLPAFAGDFSNLETTVTRLGIVQALNSNWKFKSELTDRDADGVFRLSFFSAGPAIQDSTQDRQVIEFTPRLIGNIHSLNNATVTLGADLVNSDYKLSTIIGDQANDQQQRSIYAQVVVPVASSLDVTAGARYAEVENELTDGFTFNNALIEDDVAVGTLGMVYRPANEWRILLRVDQNYRFAKVDEYANAQPFFPPPPSTIILKTQEGVSNEAGVEWAANKSHLKFLVYQLELENELAFDPVSFVNVNLDETERKGFVGEGRWQPNGQWAFSFNYTFTDAEITDGNAVGNNIPLVAERSGMIGADFQLTQRWHIYGEVQAKSDRVFSGDFTNTLARLPGYGIVNAKVEYDLKEFTFTGRVNNLLDKEYSEAGFLGFNPGVVETFFPSPERNFFVTATWKF